MKLWLCGQNTGQEATWEFQGIFSSEKLADQACRDESYFIYPITLDQELPHDSCSPINGRFPRVEDNKEKDDVENLILSRFHSYEKNFEDGIDFIPFIHVDSSSFVSAEEESKEEIVQVDSLEKSQETV